MQRLGLNLVSRPLLHLHHIPSPSPSLAPRGAAVLVRRPFHSRPPLQAAHFDTSEYVTKLEQQGLSRQQAESIIDTLEEVIEESVHNMQGNLVTRAEQDKHHFSQKVDFSSLKQSLELSEKTDFVNLKAENERLLGDIERLKQKLREEITRTQAGVRLDLNLEKGRIRDEMSVREVKLTEVDTRIESEIGLLRTSMEAVKFSILQYAFAVISGAGALLLAFLRMFAH
ncbi:hypothetical protein RQP46_006932 [Phenoliferia psychrophenolica]